MTKRVGRLLFLTGAMLSVTLLLLYQDYRRFLQTPVNLQKPLIFTIKKGMSFAEVNKRLISANLVGNSLYFEFLARFSGSTRQIRSGEYEILPGLKPAELLELFVSGKAIQYAFTLIEGWNVREMLRAMHRNEFIENTLNSDNAVELAKALAYPETNAEGLFLSETYHFHRGITDRELLEKARQHLRSVLREEWQNRTEDLPYQNPYQALTMASIIEKETGFAGERKIIAGVFVRRLEKNMKLQTDPTVIYAMGKQFDGNIRKRDLDIDSPYNTYRYTGLPPGPIALVGREAIHAALNPIKGKYLYFVSKGDGSHYFSETLREHQQAVAKYQLKR